MGVPRAPRGFPASLLGACLFACLRRGGLGGGCRAGGARAIARRPRWRRVVVLSLRCRVPGRRPKRWRGGRGTVSCSLMDVAPNARATPKPLSLNDSLVVGGQPFSTSRRRQRFLGGAHRCTAWALGSGRGGVWVAAPAERRHPERVALLARSACALRRLRPWQARRGAPTRWRLLMGAGSLAV